MEKRSLRANDCAEDVIKKYSDMVYRLAFAKSGSKYDADEIYQEVFLRYIRTDTKFENEEHRKAWLIKVTINCHKKLAGSVWRNRVTRLDEASEEVVFENARDNELWHSLQALPPKYREVIHLFYYEDMSIDDISRSLGRKCSTVRTQLTRARMMLKAVLDEGKE